MSSSSNYTSWDPLSTWDFSIPKNLGKPMSNLLIDDPIKRRTDTNRMLNQMAPPPPGLPLPFNVFQSQKEYISSTDRITIINSK